MTPTATRRLLVITYHFPPDGAVGGLRWAGFSKYLARRGWEVHIVTAAAAGKEPLPANVHRHTSSRRRTLNDVYVDSVQAIRKRLAAQQPTAVPGDSANGQPGTNTSQSIAGQALGEIRLAVRMAMGFPDVGRGWVIGAARVARNLLDEKPFDAVVTSGPPHSVHFAGMLALMGRDARVFIEMRDPWHQRHEAWGGAGVTARCVRTLYQSVSRTLMHRAAGVIVNTREHAEKLRAANPGLAVAYIPNGIDLEALPARTSERLEGFSIAYVGTVYLSRNFSVVVDAMRSLFKRRPELIGSLTLQVAGHIDPAYVQRVRDELAADGLENVVTFHGLTSRARALDLLARSNLALVLAQNQPTQIPAKIYECVGLGVPTLVIAEAESATAREAHRIGALTLESHDVAGVDSLLESIVEGRLPDTMPAKVPISYEVLAAEMDAVLRTDARSRSA